jgi:predicted glycosyltransferase
VRTSNRRPHLASARAAEAWTGRALTSDSDRLAETKCTRTRTLLLYAQDSRGLGHVTRALTIVRHVLADHPSLVAYVATKSAVGRHFTLPDRCDYIKLPTRLTLTGVPQTAEGEEADRQRFRRIRGQILREAALAIAPDLVLVDHEPLGSAGEFREGLYALKAERPATRFVFGLRDVMDDPDRIRAAWREMGVYEAFEELYDGIAVYGSPKLHDVAQAYAIPASVQPKLHYCGYIVRDLPAVDCAVLRDRYGLPRHGPLLVAAVGSGSDGYPVLAATRQAVELLRARFPDLCAVLVTGPFMPAQERELLNAQSRTTCRVVPEADTFQLMAAADVVVSMGGYNSVCEALVAACPLVIVPRATHKVEQYIRAQALAAHDLARCIHPADLTGESLAAALAWVLGRDRQAQRRLVREVIPSFDGAARLTAYLSPWLDGA